MHWPFRSTTPNSVELAWHYYLGGLDSGFLYYGVADQLNGYFLRTGNPDWFNEDLARYRALTPSSVRAAAARFLPRDRRVELTVIPEK